MSGKYVENYYCVHCQTAMTRDDARFHKCLRDQAVPEGMQQLARETYALLNLGGAVKLPNSTIALLAEQMKVAYSFGVAFGMERVGHRRRKYVW